MRSKDMLCMGLVNDSEQKKERRPLLRKFHSHAASFKLVITKAQKSTSTPHLHFLPSVRNLANGVFKT